MITRMLLFIVVVSLASPVAAADPGLLTFDATGGAIENPTPADNSVVSAYDVRLNDGLLIGLESGDRFEMKLPDERSVTIVVERVFLESGLGSAGRTIRGRIDGQPTGNATFIVSLGGVTGIVNTGEFGTWRIRPMDGRHVLQEVEAKHLPPCAGTSPEPDLLPRTEEAVAGYLCEDGSRVDVLIFYTTVARIDAGGQTTIENEINLAVDATNQAYENSAIGQRLRVVGLQEIDYDESTNYAGHLSRLTDGDDGYMDEAHTLREELAADLVALIVADGENCGIAYLMPANSTNSEYLGFSVTTWYCAANLVLAHELGHNMGCCHAPGDGGGCSGGGLYEYSVGYRYYGDSGTRWRTVMAYNPGARITHFSNPEVQFDGEPTGVPGEEADPSDNARTMNETALAISNYRRPPCAGNAHDDCVIDFVDILKILANWGVGGGRSDVNEDGIVDFLDVLFVLSHWGPCVYE